MPLRADQGRDWTRARRAELADRIRERVSAARGRARALRRPAATCSTASATSACSRPTARATTPTTSRSSRRSRASARAATTRRSASRSTTRCATARRSRRSCEEEVRVLLDRLAGEVERRPRGRDHRLGRRAAARADRRDALEAPARRARARPERLTASASAAAAIGISHHGKVPSSTAAAGALTGAPLISTAGTCAGRLREAVVDVVAVGPLLGEHDRGAVDARVSVCVPVEALLAAAGQLSITTAGRGRRSSA